MTVIVNCSNCGQKNKINEHSDTSQAICAKCWTQLAIHKESVQPPPVKPRTSETTPTSDTLEGGTSILSRIIILMLIIGGFVLWVTLNQTNEAKQEIYSSSDGIEKAYVAPVSNNPKVAQQNKNEKYSLTVTHTPKTARVRILNIKSKYQDGIELKEGKYHIEVSQDGYTTSKEWVTLLKDSIFDFSLSFPKVPEPYSGAEQVYTNDTKMAPFTIETSEGANYLVKLVSANSQKTIMTIFVKGGNTVSTKVPLGRYEVKYASGSEWYGYKHLFGKETGYSKAESIFNFEMTGYQISGYTITLYRVSNGNLRTSTIDPSQF